MLVLVVLHYLGFTGGIFLSCSFIVGSDPGPTKRLKLAPWQVKDAIVMLWILESIDPHIVLNLRPYKIVKSMWEFLKKVYNQDNTTRRFQ